MAKTTTTPKAKFVSPFESTLLTLLVGALTATASKETWQNALEKAGTKLAEVPVRLVDGRLSIASDSGNVYAATRSDCQCEAFTANGRNVGCWHRAAFVLVNRYYEMNTLLGKKA